MSDAREIIAAKFLEWIDAPGPFYSEEFCPPGFKPGDPMTDIDDAFTAADAILSALSKAGYTVARLEPILAPNDDGAGGMFTDENGQQRSYSRPGTSRVIGYCIASPVAPPVSREAQ